MPGLPNGIPRAAFNPLVVNPILYPLDYYKVSKLIDTSRSTPENFLDVNERFWEVP